MKDQCDKCAGCGQVANDEESTPWKYWVKRPVRNGIAILTETLKPLTCSQCEGTGRRKVEARLVRRPGRRKTGKGRTYKSGR